ncbi:MAG: hypothetical protein ACE15F_17415 [bacterium]
MSGSVPFHLCSVCANTSTCSHPQQPAHLLPGCEEFVVQEQYIPTFKWIARRIYLDECFLTTLSPHEETNLYKGLCVDCANRESCTYPRTDGGIFHCEEYL